MSYYVFSDYIARKRGELSARGRDPATFHVTQSGLHVCPDAGWLAASPDGHVREEEEEGIQKGLLEIKCPYSKRIYPSIPEVCIQGFFFL
jgi:hypothetical protein